MGSSYLNIFSFLSTTGIYYYFLKPPLTLDVLNDIEKKKTYNSKVYLNLGIYMCLILLTQFLCNTRIISSTCGGDFLENAKTASIFTFLPWIFIFGVLVVTLTVYPGFKTAFSDVVGYYWISGKANEYLTDLLVDPNIQNKINADDNLKTPEQKEAMQTAADSIIKICGNTSILINQIFTTNFTSYWKILDPLKKDKYKNDGADSDIKNKLFDLVVVKENVGEFMWYLYTGILLTSLVQLKMTTKGCTSNPKTMEANYNKFLAAEANAKQANDLATSTQYTITT